MTPGALVRRAAPQCERAAGAPLPGTAGAPLPGTAAGAHGRACSTTMRACGLAGARTGIAPGVHAHASSAAPTAPNLSSPLPGARPCLTLGFTLRLGISIDQVLFQQHPDVGAVDEPRADHVVHVEQRAVLEPHAPGDPELHALGPVVVADDPHVGEPADPLARVAAAHDEGALADVHPDPGVRRLEPDDRPGGGPVRLDLLGGRLAARRDVRSRERLPPRQHAIGEDHSLTWPPRAA
mmetsp:Transcript_41663/g.117774  ORF Transcript_41663/g.117774 Transcript_41663/m.117774 type:complete len:238 (+) Transcript_41663:1-714(+)